MEQALTTTPLYARTIAFFRFRGLRERQQYGLDLGPRSARLLERLEAPPGSLGFWLALVDAAHDSDLLSAEASCNKDCLELQSRLLELGREYEIVDRIFRKGFEFDLAMSIVSDIILGCASEGASAARFRYPGGEALLGEMQVGGVWSDIGALPADYWPDIVGSCLRLSNTLEALRRYLPRSLPPTQFNFTGSPVSEIVMRPEALA